MAAFERGGGRLRCEEVDLGRLASEVGTPVYVYSKRSILARYRELRDAFAPLDPLVCFSVKSNGNLAVLDLLRAEGSGFDVVSEGELHRALAVGADPARIVFAGVGKTEAEIRAAVDAGVSCLNVESGEELELVSRVAAERGKRARVLVRVNPDVDARTHKHITTGRRENKFGVAFDEARTLFAQAARFPGVELRGLHCHIGSQIVEVAPYVAAVEAVLALVDELRSGGAAIDTLNLGGGFGIAYRADGLPLDALARELVPRIAARDLRLVLEPGRAIVGEAGALLATVLYRKAAGASRLAVLDAGMTELIRPALYDAWHGVEVVAPRAGAAEETVDLVGPICESSDVLARGRSLPALERGDVVAILQAGAYGFTMASNYNSRPRPPEVLVDGASWRVVRERETLDDLIRGERT